MNSVIKIGVIGDYDGRPSHVATDEAIKHGATKLGLDIEVKWLPTDSLEKDVAKRLNCFDGLWCAPGSPYKSMSGAVNGIQYARENNIPFLGTCGGFQHAVIEYARNILNIEEARKDDFDPYAPNTIISALSCSLLNQSRHISIDKNTEIYRIYGTTHVEEKYNCNFGLDRGFQAKLVQNGITIAGMDEEGETRIIMIEKNKFFVATLFQPQLSSTYDNPHPLILAYLSAASGRNRVD